MVPRGEEYKEVLSFDQTMGAVMSNAKAGDFDVTGRPAAAPRVFLTEKSRVISGGRRRAVSVARGHRDLCVSICKQGVFGETGSVAWGRSLSRCARALETRGPSFSSFSARVSVRMNSACALAAGKLEQGFSTRTCWRGLIPTTIQRLTRLRSSAVHGCAVLRAVHRDAGQVVGRRLASSRRETRPRRSRRIYGAARAVELRREVVQPFKSTRPARGLLGFPTEGTFGVRGSESMPLF